MTTHAAGSVRLVEWGVNLTTLALIATALKAEQPANASLHRALDRAAAQIESGRSFELRGNILQIQSASRPWLIHSCTVDSCDCEAQQGVCWHRAACALLVTYQTLEAAAALCVPLIAPKPQPARAARRSHTAQAHPLDRARIDAIKAAMTPDEIAESLAA